MKNKNRYLYIILLILLAITSYYIVNNSNTTIKDAYSNFAFADTASITKIFIVDKTGEQVLLERKKNYWEVNKKYRTRIDAIEMLLKTIKDIEVKAPVSKAAMETQIKHLAAKSVKVEIYAGGNKPAKVYYVGGATDDNQGTYMLLENSTKPYIVHVPGFFGYLSTRYFTEEELWRQSWIFKSNYEDIASVRLDYPKDETKGFTAVNLGNNKFELYRNFDNQKINIFDSTQVKLFIGNFMSIGYEAPIVNMKPEKRDSLEHVKPEKIYTVKLKNNKEQTLRLYLVKAEEGRTDAFGNPIDNDPDRLYGFFDGFKELVTVQTLSINPVTKEINDFLPKR
jgi:hypothetical protein